MENEKVRYYVVHVVGGQKWGPFDGRHIDAATIADGLEQLNAMMEKAGYTGFAHRNQGDTGTRPHLYFGEPDGTVHRLYLAKSWVQPEP